MTSKTAGWCRHWKESKQAAAIMAQRQPTLIASRTLASVGNQGSEAGDTVGDSMAVGEGAIEGAFGTGRYADWMSRSTLAYRIIYKITINH
jgi:hypothetical protein